MRTFVYLEKDGKSFHITDPEVENGYPHIGSGIDVGLKDATQSWILNTEPNIPGWCGELQDYSAWKINNWGTPLTDLVWRPRRMVFTTSTSRSEIHKARFVLMFFRDDGEPAYRALI